MNVHDQISDLIIQLRSVSLPHFLPELIVCATIVLNLLVRIVKLERWIDAFCITLVGSIAALMAAAPWSLGASGSLGEVVQRTELFSGMLVYDGFSVLMRSLLLIFVVLFTVFTKLTGVPDREDSGDIYTLVLGSTLGMMLMCSANHLLMVFMAVEMASVPSYALAGLLKGRRQSSEAALKYCIYGAGTAGVMLYGISLLSGLVNSVHLPTMAARLVERLPTMGPEETMVLGLGGMMLGVGLAFKLSAVPFHFWCPDVFEGATAEVNAFLSIASKAAALALLVRVALGLGMVPALTGDSKVAARPPAQAVVSTVAGAGLYSVADDPVSAEKPEAAKSTGDGAAEATPSVPPAESATVASSGDATSRTRTPAESLKILAPVRGFTAKLIAFIAIVTCTFGNLAAYGQTNIKRLFAYSTIAHAGYMMMAVPAILAAAGVGEQGRAVAAQGAASLGIYIGVYLAMNLGAFAVIAFLRNSMRSEEISDYAGLLRREPVLTVCFVVILFALIGLPPLSGFFGKLAVFASLSSAYKVVSQANQSANYLLWLLIAGGVNTVISLYYYLRVVKVMTWETESRDQPPTAEPMRMYSVGFVVLLTVPTLIWIVGFEVLAKWCSNATSSLL